MQHAYGEVAGREHQRAGQSPGRSSNASGIVTETMNMTAMTANSDDADEALVGAHGVAQPRVAAPAPPQQAAMTSSPRSAPRPVRSSAVSWVTCVSA